MRILAAISAILSTLFLALLPTAVLGAEPILTQRDWMVNLVDTLGYNFGLPDMPQEADYSNLLAGGRTFRFEAEAVRHPDDQVAVNAFTTFGAFSGPGWISAISAPTTVRMNFLLPHGGTYRLSASVRLPGHTLMLEGQSWQITASNPNFQRMELGEITLEAGMKELIVNLPANGSMDYFEFTAPPLAAISPLSAWDPGAPLTTTDLAVTTIRALLLQDLLPLQGDKILLEAEDCATDKNFITDQRHLGEPHGGLWLRCNASGKEITLPFTIADGAVYTFNIIAAGAQSLSGRLDGRAPWATLFPTYLREQTIGTWYLSPGPHELEVDLPSRGGIDLLTLLKRRSTALDYRILAGLPPDETDVQPNDVNRLLTLLARLQSRD